MAGWTHQGPHRAVQRVAVVPAELGVGALERGDAVRLGLLDAALRVNLRLLQPFSLPGALWGLTRCGGSCAPGCAATSFSILRVHRQRGIAPLESGGSRTGHCRGCGMVDGSGGG
jgi:hypothetical protein